MRNWTGADAVAHILGAADAAAAFAEASGDKRRTARLYRVLAFAVHPDRAALEGIDPADADAATKRLNELYEHVKDGGTKPAPKPAAAPHVVGKNGTYLFGARIPVSRGTGQFTVARTGIATYDTDRPGIFIDIARKPARNPEAHALVAVAPKLEAAGLAAYAPTLLDAGATDGRAWVTYQLPEGTYTLRQVLAAYPMGLDGRDWAWMARRLFMVLDAAGQAHGELTLDTIHVHPEGHGIILSGWAGGAGDGEDIRDIFRDILGTGPDARRQRQFAAAATTLAPAKALAEYDLLLRALYGERRFRPFAMPA